MKTIPVPKDTLTDIEKLLRNIREQKLTNRVFTGLVKYSYRKEAMEKLHSDVKALLVKKREGE